MAYLMQHYKINIKEQKQLVVIVMAFSQQSMQQWQ